MKGRTVLFCLHAMNLITTSLKIKGKIIAEHTTIKIGLFPYTFQF